MSIIKVFVAVITVLILRCKSLSALNDLWPSGEYSLPKPLSGCPKLWKEGWLQQDLEDDAVQNRSKLFSSNIHMDASIVVGDFVVRGFCTKITDQSEGTITGNPWPKGSYCIYRKNDRCPHDMVGGSIYFDDEDTNNGDSEGGIVPDLHIYSDKFTTGTKLYYCCQNQGEWQKPVRLPTENPFYLLPYGSRNCQRVKWAISSLEYIIYDTEDNRNRDTFTEPHVFTDKVKSFPKIFYCYYEGCQYKLQNDHGFITTSDFLNNSYPDFQICSWSITVNASMIIFLEFQTINIPNCEENYLDIYDGRRDNATTLLARFCGKNATSGAKPKVTSKMNNLYIVLKSGDNSEWSKNLQFYAEYKAFRQEQATTTTYSTTTIPPTSNSFNGGRKNTNSFDGGRKDLQDANSDNSSIYLSIILPILAILIILGIMGAIFYCRRQNKESNAATQQAMQELNQDSRRYASHTPTSQTSPEFGVTSKAGTNPIYESGESAGYEYEPGAVDIHNTTDNVLYEPANELLTGNPVYEGIDDNVDSTYAEPIQ